MLNSSDNYPPGVTGDEPEIVGPYSEDESIELCGNCGIAQEGVVIVQCQGDVREFHCPVCNGVTDLPPYDQ